MQGHVAYIGPVLGPTSAPDAKSNLRPNVPKLGPSGLLCIVLYPQQYVSYTYDII